MLKEPTWLGQKQEVVEQEAQKWFVASYLRGREEREEVEKEDCQNDHCYPFPQAPPTL